MDTFIHKTFIVIECNDENDCCYQSVCNVIINFAPKAKIGVKSHKIFNSIICGNQV